MAAFSFLDQILHRLALQATPIAELSFDMDQRSVRKDPREIIGERHVFVSGLARAGTTVLMRHFHATGAYRSLTYRDMPFVLAPNLWRRLTPLAAGPRPAAELIRQAHAAGHSRGSLRRAKRALRVRSVKPNNDAAWLWTFSTV